MGSRSRSLAAKLVCPSCPSLAATLALTSHLVYPSIPICLCSCLVSHSGCLSWNVLTSLSHAEHSSASLPHHVVRNGCTHPIPPIPSSIPSIFTPWLFPPIPTSLITPIE